MLDNLKNNMALILFGCIWGISELTLGGFLHFIHYPLKGQVMEAIGYTIMAAYVIRYRKPWGPLFMGCIAASFKLFSVFIFGVPLFSKMIINPAISIIIEAAASTVVAFTVFKVIEIEAVKNTMNRFKL